MEINIHSEKRTYEVGDLIEIRGCYGFRMIVKVNTKRYALMNMNGQISTCTYSSMEELLDNRVILNHYKNEDLQLSLKKKRNR